MVYCYNAAYGFINIINRLC